MKYVYALAAIAAFATPAFAAQTMSSLPPDSFTVTDYYKQDVYDQSKNTVGKIDDVLIDKSGKITALIVGVGGFLGMGEWDVALPFTAVKAEKKDNKWYLTVDETKELFERRRRLQIRQINHDLVTCQQVAYRGLALLWNCFQGSLVIALLP